jgi:CheY-like chemotaxis protein
MLWFPEWRVLVVDDDPDVLRLSELALRHVEVEGVPVKVFNASSKAEAIEVLNTHFAEPGGLGLLTVALIDVVMETDNAGLELCDYIRNTMHNSVAQIYIRTGQPGVAPERDVIDDYDITGYFTKVEATEDKLYTMVKSGVRQYVLSVMSVYSALTLVDVIGSSLTSQERIGESLNGQYAALMQQRGDEHSGVSIWIGDRLVLCAGYNAETAEQHRHHLLSMPARSLSPAGETLAVDAAAREGLLSVPAGPQNPSVMMLGAGHSLPKSDFIYLLSAWTIRSLGMLWMAAGQRTFAR